ncbi:60S acidic ribosomal protein p2 [Cucumis melo var. makuwa]|uniref:60S acidic ribosomal protein p2 n=1 Tax=Cucumis melo var. makuwa TaxID=1194695 RepID=A0A5D3DHV6_CUCMM|nr:60S acidic ribosomal protein p2 [Cucumis melo var. makuwa]
MELHGKDVTELITSGREKLSYVPSGGGAAVAVTTGGGGGGAAASAPAKAKKEEKVEEKEESDDDATLLPKWKAFQTLTLDLVFVSLLGGIASS